MFSIMSILQMNINPQKGIFHNNDFPDYTASKYRDLKLDTYWQTTLIWHFGVKFDQDLSLYYGAVKPKLQRDRILVLCGIVSSKMHLKAVTNLILLQQHRENGRPYVQFVWQQCHTCVNGNVTVAYCYIPQIM